MNLIFLFLPITDHSHAVHVLLMCLILHIIHCLTCKMYGKNNTFQRVKMVILKSACETVLAVIVYRIMVQLNKDIAALTMRKRTEQFHILQGYRIYTT